MTTKLFKRKSDNVFQLSLTEIAFMLIFIFILLLSWMYFQKSEENKRLEENVHSSNQKLEEYGKTTKIMNEVIQKLSLNDRNPDEVISQLDLLLQSKNEIERLKEKLEDQDDTLTALTELLSAHNQDKETLTKKLNEILDFRDSLLNKLKSQEVSFNNENEFNNFLDDAIKLNSLLHKKFDSNNTTVDEKEKIIDDVLRKLNNDSFKENVDLKGQVAFLKKKLEANGGRDYPPCWADKDTGAIQYLFKIDIFSEGLKVTPIWPSERNEDIKLIPNTESLTNKLHSKAAFQRLTQPILNESKNKQCRHYVKIKNNNVNNTQLYNSYRYAIENVFYKLELR